MARYIVRVELRGADSEDYENLHKKMEAKGYSREIQDGNGTRFHLPTAEYTTVKSSTAYNVREEVRGVASSVTSSYYVLATEVSDISWYLARK
ncbi:type V toxin-antitoxin system endoribonuclease antitoxin GhoS [Pantoea agglomerans]|uniref:type V toxin-antitoxin system endoribonuclease antitoxin GhoS n=1 Tax=Enterobacter agglomerans TaxID=549 RepID=UPI00177AF9B4|nr:type V toxin-antitoxin system endoribonuclease antitoxin GhoS [Pantoea agglomerans]MBD8241336.1 type V toxin-antitoxin system endoribonuclease antitoxin GhoS [Pantoea agglomerans]